MADDGDLANWHGWSHELAATYVHPLPDGSTHVGLYVQQDRTTELAAVFVDAAMAQMFMDWMDGALTETAAANTELLKRLENEQPLLFAPTGYQPEEPPPAPDGSFVHE